MTRSTTIPAALLALALGAAPLRADAHPPASDPPQAKPVATPATADAPSKPAMAKADETILPIGSVVPDFTLKTADGKEINLKAYSGKSVTVLTFLSKNCPISRAWHKEIAAIAGEYEKKGVKFIGLMSNSTVTTFLVSEGIKFPILDDPGNVVADKLDAIATPQMYVIDAAGKLAYTGAINNSAREATKVTKEYFKTALASVVAGKPVADPSPLENIGCTIKRAVKS
ncbi:MAG: redoxin domain-containing protein [Candidatus Eisenbacteria bacterium]|nr:redoxin domain-containing protein [Candidatus Eisenbacteria bacterium]